MCGAATRYQGERADLPNWRRHRPITYHLLSESNLYLAAGALRTTMFTDEKLSPCLYLHYSF